MRLRKSLILLACVCLSSAALAEEVSLDGMAYPTAREARAAWRPIDELSPPVGVGEAAGQKLLTLPYNFKTNTEWRVGWDRSGRWDLSGCQRIELKTSVAPDRAVSMLLYLQSGDGWYRASFIALPDRSHVVLARKQFGIEERPGGWDKIRRIRLSIVRGQAIDGEVGLGPIRATGGPAMVAVYRNDAGIAREGAVGKYVQAVADSLDRIGVAYDILTDPEVAAGKLGGKKVVILPLNPVLPKAPGRQIERFVAGGGKLIVCYHAPHPLEELLGIRAVGVLRGEGGRLREIAPTSATGLPPVRQDSWLATKIVPGQGTEVVGTWQPMRQPAVARNTAGYFIGHVLTSTDRGGKDRLLRAMLGELWQGMWQQTYGGRLVRLGQVAGFAGVKPLQAAVLQNLAGNKKDVQAMDVLHRADSAAVSARQLAAKGDYPAAVERLEAAQQLYLTAYARSVPPKPGEFRAVWCHSPMGVQGRSWDQAIRLLSQAGFNAILANMLWGGGAAYPSDVLPTVGNARRGGDQLALCLAAAKRYGVALHVWKVNWRLWHDTPGNFRAKLREEGRLQQDPHGKTLDWLCPSNPANQKLELDAMVEIVRKYDVAGVHFDYIRYPGLEGCYCRRCRGAFQEAFGVRLDPKDWPKAVIDGPLREKYLQFRRDNITCLVAAVSREARKIRPSIQISAAVFWNYPVHRDSIGQDWVEWLKKGYVDFVCPMQYTPDAAEFEQELRLTEGLVGEARQLRPGIGATIGHSPDQTLQQVLITRNHKTAGFVLFNYDGELADTFVPLLRLGATRPQ